jgi:hypothetical protein
VEWWLKMSMQCCGEKKGMAEKETERWVGRVGGVLVEDEHAVLW